MLFLFWVFGFKSRIGGCSLIFAVFNGFRIKWALHCVSVVVGSCEFGDFDCCDVSVNRVDGSDEGIFVGLKIWEEQCGMNQRMALVIFETLSLLMQRFGSAMKILVHVALRYSVIFKIFKLG